MWSYTLAGIPERPGHTRLTERRELPTGPGRLSELLVHAAQGGAEAFDAELLAGIEATLAAVKAEAETAKPIL